MWATDDHGRLHKYNAESNSWDIVDDGSEAAGDGNEGADGGLSVAADGTVVTVQKLRLKLDPSKRPILGNNTEDDP